MAYRSLHWLCVLAPLLFGSMVSAQVANAQTADPTTGPNTQGASPGGAPASSGQSPANPGSNSGSGSSGSGTGGGDSSRPSLMPQSSGATSPSNGPSGTTFGASTRSGDQPQQIHIDPNADQKKLEALGHDRPGLIETEMAMSPRAVYSEDWWAHTRPVFEIHGYFRTRAELFHNFTLGRHNAPGDNQNLWPQPLDQSYGDSTGKPHDVVLCGDPSVTGALQRCIDKTQATANLRLRLNPEIHISDNLRIMSQVDMLDNLVLGSTPDSYAIQPSSKTTSGYGPAGNGYNGYAPLGFFSTTQGPPTAGVNGYKNSIDVKRAWAEYLSPIGQFRFGRMPSHWGLGMVSNSGDYLDADYQTTVDRIMFVSGFKPLDLYFGGSWDFVSTGQTTASPYDVYGGQDYNTGNLTNVDQWTAFIARKMNPDLQRGALARGEIVINGGLYTMYRQQYLDVKAGDNPLTFDSTDDSANRNLERRGAQSLIPDLWVQAMWKKLRVEAELAAIYGQIAQTPQNANISTPVLIRQYGLTTQAEYKAIEDKLRLNFGFGYASGDPWVNSLNPGNSGFQQELNGGRGPISTFRFNPAYQVDLIFFRQILSRVEGAYYFRPSVDYDFFRNPNGQKFGGGAAIIWSRASEFVQTPGHRRDLGVELDLNIYYQAKDGSLNDDPTKVGGFYTMLQYGVFFPLGGLSYLPGEQKSNLLDNWDTSSAQTVRLFLGVAF